MSYRIELRNCLIGLQDGFSGSVLISDASIVAADGTLLVDQSSLDLHDDATVVPVGARLSFTADPTAIRTVTAQNSNKTWLITIGADTVGTYTLTFNGQTTAAIAGTDGAAAIQAALVALSNVAAGDLIVSGTGPYTVEARGAYLGLASPVMTATPTSLDNFAFAVVQPGNRTWSVTFSPVLSAAIPTNGDTITFLPQRVFMKTGKGNFEATINKDTVVDTDRGLLDGARLADEKPMDITTSFVLSFLRASSGQPITVYEALEREGNAASWHNASPSPCEPYAPEIFVIHKPPCGSEEAEVWTFPQFYPNTEGVNISDALVSLKGISVATKPEITREPSALYTDLFESV